MCAATFYDFEADGSVLAARIVAKPCPAPAELAGGWGRPKPRYCVEHGRQLAEVERLGLSVPDPATFPPGPTVEQPALI